MTSHEETRAAPAATPLDPDGELRRLAGDCVHCGFCLPSCPTYQLWGEEMDSPRGRIHLMTQILDGGQGSPAALTHFDRCLGCMACMPACPSGVQYDKLIEAARSWSEEPAAAALPSGGSGGSAPRGGTVLPPRSRRERMIRAAIFATFPYPRRLRALAGPLRAAQLAHVDSTIAGSKLLARLLPEAAAALAVAPTIPGPEGRLPARVAARGERRATVGMLTGCVQQVFFPRVNESTARVLAAEGCDVVIPPGQGCCGALSVHGGRRRQAAAFARSVIETFEQADVDAVVVNAAGCGSAMKDYGHLLADDPAWAGRAVALSAKVRDFSEFLADLGPVATRHELPMTIAYQDACHLGHAQRVTEAPRSLLRGIPGVQLAELGDGGTCCGSAGIYNLVQPKTAAELGARKARAVLGTRADLLVSANPGCTMQISKALEEQGHSLQVAHIAEVIDASIRSRPASTLLGAERAP